MIFSPVSKDKSPLFVSEAAPTPSLYVLSRVVVSVQVYSVQEHPVGKRVGLKLDEHCTPQSIHFWAGLRLPGGSCYSFDFARKCHVSHPYL